MHTRAQTYTITSTPKVAQAGCTDPSRCYYYDSIPVQSPFGLFSSIWTCQVWVDSCRPDLLELVSSQLWFVLISKALILMGPGNQAKWKRRENWLKLHLKSGRVQNFEAVGERQTKKKKKSNVECADVFSISVKMKLAHESSKSDSPKKQVIPVRFFFLYIKTKVRCEFRWRIIYLSIYQWQ